MLAALADFKEHSRLLQDLNVQEEQTNYSNVRFIKNQVLELAEQVDKMSQCQNKQSLMISYLVNTI